jgi:hypothetical protein
VEVLEGEEGLAEIEARERLIEAAGLAQMEEELAPGTEVEDQEEIPFLGFETPSTD